MHQLLEDILPWLLGFYVLDSVALQAAGETLFVRPVRAFAAVRGPLLAGLLPWSEVVSASVWPVRFSKAKVYFPQGGGFAAVPWEDLGLVQRTAQTLLAGGQALRLPAPEDARGLAALLARLRDTPVGQRGAELASAFQERSDVVAVRRLRERAGRHRWLLSGLGSLLLLGLFVLLPLSLDPRVSPALPLGGMLGIIAIAYLAIVGLSWRVLRGCGLARTAALGTMANLFFLPATAGHAQSFLTRRLYAAFDPLAVAAVLLPPERFRRFAREAFHRLRHDETGLHDHMKFAEESWRRVVAESGLQSADILSAPSAADPTAASYCPLCSAYYRPRFTDCSDCRVALLPLESAA